MNHDVIHVMFIFSYREEGKRLREKEDEKKRKLELSGDTAAATVSTINLVHPLRKPSFANCDLCMH